MSETVHQFTTNRSWKKNHPISDVGARSHPGVRREDDFSIRHEKSYTPTFFAVKYYQRTMSEEEEHAVFKDVEDSEMRLMELLLQSEVCLKLFEMRTNEFLKGWLPLQKYVKRCRMHQDLSEEEKHLRKIQHLARKLLTSLSKPEPDLEHLQKLLIVEIDINREIMAEAARLLGTPAKVILEQIQLKKDKIVRSYLRMVRSVAAMLLGRGVELDDLIQEGSIGLIRAINLFDWRLGFRFSSYAVWAIKSYALKAIENKSNLVTIPSNLTTLVRRIQNLAIQDELRTGKIQPAEKVADKLGEPLHRVVLALSVMRHDPFNINSLVPRIPNEIADVEEYSYSDILHNEEAPEASSRADVSTLRDGLVKLLATLPQREEDILKMRFGFFPDRAEDYAIDHTLQEIGDMMGMTRERIRQIELKGLKKISRRARHGKLRDFFV